MNSGRVLTLGLESDVKPLNRVLERDVKLTYVKIAVRVVDCVGTSAECALLLVPQDLTKYSLTFENGRMKVDALCIEHQ